MGVGGRRVKIKGYMYFLMPNHKKIKIKNFVQKIKKKWGGPPLSLRGIKNSLRPILRPTEYTQKIS